MKPWENAFWQDFDSKRMTRDEKKGIQESDRLTAQQKENGGAERIFGESAQVHEQAVHSVSEIVLRRLQQKYPKLSFRYRNSIPQKEINEYLQKIDSSLGQTLFVSNANIRPDGGIIEVQDDYGRWRIVVVSEAKFQGKDIDNIKAGVFVGKKTTKFSWLPVMPLKGLIRILEKSLILC